MKTKFSRKGKNIKNVDTGQTTKFDSINLAKKESHRIQKAEGGLGNGVLVNES